MKFCSFIAGVVLSTSIFSGVSKAASLLPGTVATPDASTVTGTLIASISGPFTGTNTVAGTYSERVYREAGGTISFVYDFTNANTEGLARMTTIDYTGFTSNVSYVAGTGNIPDSADRSNSGVIGFSFDINNRVEKGESADTLIIRTNALNYKAGTINFIDGGVAQVAGFAPTTAPAVPLPPAAWASAPVLLALAGIGAARRRAQRNALAL